MKVEEAAGLWDGLVDFATASDLQAKRMRVLQLHVDELKRQAHAREGENRQLLEKVSEHARQQKEKKPQERRLFARLEHMQAEVLTLREQRTVAEAHARELQAQLEKVVDAAEAEQQQSPEQLLLLRVTTQQLEATQTLLQQAQQAASEAEERERLAVAEAAAERTLRGQAALGAELVERRLNEFIEKNAQAAMLTLPPSSKGGSLLEQRDILEWRERFLSMELARKTSAAEGLVLQKEALLQKLETIRQAAAEARGKQRQEAKEREAASQRQLGALRKSLAAHVEALDHLRRGSQKIDQLNATSTRHLVTSMVRAAVRGGALAGLQWRVRMEREGAAAVNASLAEQVEALRAAMDVERDAAALAAAAAESRAAELAERLATAEEQVSAAATRATATRAVVPAPPTPTPPPHISARRRRRRRSWPGLRIGCVRRRWRWRRRRRRRRAKKARRRRRQHGRRRRTRRSKSCRRRS